MTPTIPLTDPRFIYVPAVQTDIRKTFERARQQMARSLATVKPIKQKAAA